MRWSIIYESAVKRDQSLYFPEELTHDFLLNARKTMGMFLFANQYLNVVFPDDAKKFKREWFRYYTQLPANVSRFIFIDPAISLNEDADYTGIVVVAVCPDKNWYIELAQRYRLSPTELVEKIFQLNLAYQPKVIGIEEIAYQKALLYMVDQEMHRRGQLLPIQGVHPGTDKSKEMRISGLVPRFEWGFIHLKEGMDEFEHELLQFPRGKNDDIIDALSQLDSIIYYPPKEERPDESKNPYSSEYERAIIRNLTARANSEIYGEGSDDAGF